MPSCRRWTRRLRGVTLLEVLLAMSLLVVLTTMTYSFYSSMLHVRDVGTADAHRFRLVRAVMDQLANEIRQATVMTVDGHVGIRGNEEHLWLSTFRVPSRELSKPRGNREPPPPNEYDMKRVEYSIARHPEILHEQEGWELPLGLARSETLVPRPTSVAAIDEFADDGEAPESADESTDEAPDAGSQPDDLEERLFDEIRDEEQGRGGERIGRDANIRWQELYAPEIRHLRLCYYDGNQWWDTWEVEGENPLPQMVMVTIGFEAHPPLEDVRGRDKVNEEFCECLNRDPPDCEPLPSYEYTQVIRAAQADPLFRSRVTRETQSFLEQATAGEEEEDDGGGGQP